jgi:hypothetical protein
MEGGASPFSSIVFRLRGEEIMAQAEREPRHRTKLRNAAQAWLALALRIGDLEIAIEGRPTQPRKRTRPAI